MKTVKKAAGITAVILGLLVITIIIHVIIVTKPAVPAGAARVMARIDLADTINQSTAVTYVQWLRRQPGVDHAVCNEKRTNIVFTFSPSINNADVIATGFRSAFNNGARRYVPSEKEMQSGCPVAMGKENVVYKWINNLFN